MKTILEYLQKGHVQQTQNTDLSEEQQLMNSIRDDLTYACKDVKKVYVNKYSDTLYTIRLDYLDKADWPSGLPINSIFLSFDYHIYQSYEFHNAGHLDLTPADKEGKYKYYALKSFTAPYKDAGGKIMRKKQYTTLAKLVQDISTFANAVYDAAVKDQGSPLKRK